MARIKICKVSEIKKVHKNHSRNPTSEAHGQKEKASIHFTTSSLQLFHYSELPLHETEQLNVCLITYFRYPLGRPLVYHYYPD